MGGIPQAGVTELVRDVYRRAKASSPGPGHGGRVHVAGLGRECLPGLARLDSAKAFDYVVPMAYTPDNDALAKQLQEWKTVDPHWNGSCRVCRSTPRPPRA